MLKNPKLLVFLSCTGALAIEAFAAYIIYSSFNGDWSKASDFGESFGAVNTLFSGLALAGVVYNLVLQRNALSEQRAQTASEDLINLELKTDRNKTYQIFSKQVNELSKAAEIQAIQLAIKLIDEELKISPQKEELVGEKNNYRIRLKYLIEMSAET